MFDRNDISRLAVDMGFKVMAFRLDQENYEFIAKFLNGLHPGQYLPVVIDIGRGNRLYVGIGPEVMSDDITVAMFSHRYSPVSRYQGHADIAKHFSREIVNPRGGGISRNSSDRFNFHGRSASLNGSKIDDVTIAEKIRDSFISFYLEKLSKKTT